MFFCTYLKREPSSPEAGGGPAVRGMESAASWDTALKDEEEEGLRTGGPAEGAPAPDVPAAAGEAVADPAIAAPAACM